MVQLYRVMDPNKAKQKWTPWNRKLFNWTDVTCVSLSPTDHLMTPTTVRIRLCSKKLQIYSDLNDEHFAISKMPLADPYVVFGCFAGWLAYLTRRKVDVHLWTDCKLFYFLFDFSRFYSAMLLVLMTLEKCFAVYFPLQAKTVCTVKNSYVDLWYFWGCPERL